MLRIGAPIPLIVNTAASDMTEAQLNGARQFLLPGLAWARGRRQHYVDQVYNQDQVMEVGAITGLFTDFSPDFDDDHIPTYQRLVAAIQADLALNETELRSRRDVEEVMAGLY